MIAEPMFMIICIDAASTARLTQRSAFSLASKSGRPIKARDYISDTGDALEPAPGVRVDTNP